MKKIFYLFFFTLLFCNTAIAIGISHNKQESLINSGSIRVGMNCSTLANALGRANDLSWLFLGNKQEEYGHYVLMEVYTKDTNKIHYLCEEKRTANKESEVALEVLNSNL